MIAPSEQFEPVGWVPTLFRPLKGHTYLAVTYAFVGASLFHLWLEDASLPSWWLANGIYLLGILILSIRPGLLGWLLSAIGLVIPLLFLRDQLTQSVLLLAICVAAIVALVRQAIGRQDAHLTFLRTTQWLTIATYSLATFHKLNRDFLEPTYSCANYGIHELAVYYRTPLPAAIEGMWPWVAIGIEALIAALFLRGRYRLAWWIGVIFHLPLTLTMAPAFFFVMLIGWCAFAHDDDWRSLARGCRRHLWTVPLAMTLTSLSLWAHGTLPEPLMIPREAFLWWLLMIVPLAFKRDLGLKRGASGYSKPWVAVVAGAFVLNGLTPYLGLQFQHTGAMLSNLRIDSGCWNHLLVPEAIRLTDDYVRIDQGWFGAPGKLEQYEHIMKDQLWNPPQIRQMQRNWCKHELRPVYVSGIYRGRRFEIPDICPTPGSKVLPALPFNDDGVFGIEIFPEFIRFQKNLERQCPQACIH